MVLSGKSLKEEMGRSIKINPFREKNLSGGSYDLSLDAEFLKLKSGKTPLIDPLSLKVAGEHTIGEDIILQPNGFLLARSEEWIELSERIMAMVSGKSSLARLGLQIESAAILHPGHTGYVVLEVKNNNDAPFRLVKGMKIAQLVFFRTSDPVEMYASSKESTFKTQKGIELPRKISFSD